MFCSVKGICTQSSASQSAEVFYVGKGAVHTVHAPLRYPGTLRGFREPHKVNGASETVQEPVRVLKAAS